MQKIIDFKKYMPDKQKLLNSKSLKIFGPVLHSHYLWHLTSSSVANALAIGFFIAWIPLPIHTIAATLCAILLRANLPATLAASWICNPITIAPMFLFAYKLGAYILGVPAEKLAEFSFTIEWFKDALDGKFTPLLLGCFICGTACALVGYLSVRLMWKYFKVRD